MINKRSLLTFSSLSIAAITHAAQIQVVSSYSEEKVITQSGTSAPSRSDFMNVLPFGFSNTTRNENHSSSQGRNFAMLNSGALLGQSFAGTTAYVVPYGVYGDVTSHHWVEFQLTSSSILNMSLTSSIQVDALAPHGAGWNTATAKVELWHKVGSSWQSVRSVSDGQSFTGSETWAAGRYRVETTATSYMNAWSLSGFSANGSGNAFYNLSATPAPVPEPASMTALAFGAVALLRRRKKA